MDAGDEERRETAVFSLVRTIGLVQIASRVAARTRPGGLVQIASRVAARTRQHARDQVRCLSTVSCARPAGAERWRPAARPWPVDRVRTAGSAPALPVNGRCGALASRCPRPVDRVRTAGSAPALPVNGAEERAAPANGAEQPAPFYQGGALPAGGLAAAGAFVQRRLADARARSWTC